MCWSQQSLPRLGRQNSSEAWAGSCHEGSGWRPRPPGHRVRLLPLPSELQRPLLGPWVPNGSSWLPSTMVFLETGEFFKSMFSVKKAVKRLSEAQCLQLQKNPNEGDYLCPQSVFLAPNLTQAVNNLPANAGVTGDGVWSLGQEDPLEEERTPHLLHLLNWQVDSLPLSHLTSSKP